MRIFIKNQNGNEVVCSSAITCFNIDSNSKTSAYIYAFLTDGKCVTLGNFKGEEKAKTGLAILMNYIQGNYDTYTALCRENEIVPRGMGCNIFPMESVCGPLEDSEQENDLPDLSF